MFVIAKEQAKYMVLQGVPSCSGQHAPSEGVPSYSGQHAPSEGNVLRVAYTSSLMAIMK